MIFRTLPGMRAARAVLSIVCFSLAASVALVADTVTITGTVKDASSGNGVNGLWVVVTSVPEYNPGHLPADKAQTKTRTFGKGRKRRPGSYAVTLPCSTSSTGSIQVYDDTWQQIQTFIYHQWGPGQTYTYDIRANQLTTAPRISYIGLRESQYGLCRPSVKSWPGDLEVLGNPRYLPYNDNYAGQVQYWSSGAGWDWKQPDIWGDPVNPFPAHVLIVTQTEPSFAPPYHKWENNGGNKNGNTYVLWEKTGGDSSSDPRLKYLGDLKDQETGTQLNNANIGVDALLSEYDRLGHQVFLQIEAGHVDAGYLIDRVMRRFYLHDDGSIRHPSICGVGMDIEWYRDTDPFRDAETVTAREANAWEAKVQGYNKGFKLFVKHWDIGQGEKLAIPVEDADGTRLNKSIIVIDDSQAFDAPIETKQKEEFKKWMDYYSPNPVGYQLGYPNDKGWWTTLANPVLDNALGLRNYFGSANAARQLGFVWVDFSVRYPKPNTHLRGHVPPAY